MHVTISNTQFYILQINCYILLNMVICDKVRSGQKTKTPKYIFIALPKCSTGLAKVLKQYIFLFTFLNSTKICSHQNIQHNKNGRSSCPYGFERCSRARIVFSAKTGIPPEPEPSQPKPFGFSNIKPGTTGIPSLRQRQAGILVIG